MNQLSIDRWRYYLDQVLPADARILNKLAFYSLPRKEWINMVERYNLADLKVNNRDIEKLISESVAKKDNGVKRSAEILRAKYYGQNS